MRRVISIALLGVCWAASASAQDASPRLQIRGFGSWDAAMTDGNDYRHATSIGSYDNASLALNLTRPLTARVRFAAQLELQPHGGEEMELDYMFAEFRSSERLRMIVGQGAQPFGIYNEVYDVGTLRPFLQLPQSIYGSTGVVAEGYRGIGVAGELAPAGSRWGLGYDVYGGSVELEEDDEVAELLASPATPVDGEDEHAHVIDRLVGGRLVLRTPIQGLTIGGSAYTGINRHAESGESVRLQTLGAQVEWLGERWQLRSEVGRHGEKDEHSALGGYVEASVRLFEHWQVAALGDYEKTTVDGLDVSAAPSLLEHQEISVGVNRWFGPAAVIKASLHQIEGNRFARPAAEDLASQIAAGELKKSTRVVRIGMQLAF